MSARPTRTPTGRSRSPLILLDGLEASGKTATALELGEDPRVGPAWVIEVDETDADAYAGSFELIPHSGRLDDIVAAVEWAMLQPPVADKVPLLVIDGGSAIWDLVKADAERRARSASDAQARLEKDPHLAIEPAPCHWEAAKGPYMYGWLRRLRDWPGITVVTARGDDQVLYRDGKPTDQTFYRLDLDRDARFLFHARVQTAWPHPAKLQWTHRLGLHIPDGGLELPTTGALSHLVFEELGYLDGEEPAYPVHVAKRVVLGTAEQCGHGTRAVEVSTAAWRALDLPAEVDRVPLSAVATAVDDVLTATVADKPPEPAGTTP